MRARADMLLLAVWLTAALPCAASAQDEAASAAERAQAAERGADPELARAEWQRVVELAPGSRQARRAEGRIEWIDARAEGGYAPLRALMRYLEIPIDARDAQRIDALEREADAMPAGVVRREARHAIVADWLRIEDAERALRAAERWEAEAETDTERRIAREAAAQALALRGDRTEAIAALDAAGLGERDTRARLAREALEAWSRPLAMAALALFAISAALLAGRALRRRGRRAVSEAWSISRIGTALWVVAGPVLLATFYDDEATDTFARLALGTLVIAAGAALGTIELRKRARVPWAACVVGAELALAWLVLLDSGGLVSFP